MLVYTTKAELPFHSALYNNCAFWSKHSQNTIKLFANSEVTARDWYLDIEAFLCFYVLFIKIGIYLYKPSSKKNERQLLVKN